MTNRSISASGLLVVLITVAGAGDALAQREKTRVSAAACRPMADAGAVKLFHTDTSPLLSTSAAGGLTGTSDNFRAKIYCPIDDGVDVQAEQLTWVHVHFWDGRTDDRGLAVPCVKFHSSVGGHCAGGASNGPDSQTGDAMLELEPDWLFFADNGFAYIYIELPRGKSTSFLRGFSAGTL